MEWYDGLDDVPAWLSYTEKDVREAQELCKKHLPSKTGARGGEVHGQGTGGVVQDAPAL